MPISWWGHFTTAKTQRDLGLVTLIQETDQIAQLDGIVAVIGARAEFDFLDLDHLLFELGFVGLLGFLVFELAVVHQPADRRNRLRRNFYQIHIRRFRQTKGISKLHDTESLTLDPNQTHFRRRYFAVDAMCRLIRSDVTFPLKIKNLAVLQSDGLLE